LRDAGARDRSGDGDLDVGLEARRFEIVTGSTVLSSSEPVPISEGSTYGVFCGWGAVSALSAEEPRQAVNNAAPARLARRHNSCDHPSG